MSSSSPSPQGDIFVSFRGDDVRKTFISYLFNWLDQEGFSYFYDEEPKDAGKKIKDKIFPAIQHASVALVVLSENYANSRWCLNELVKILECNDKHKKPFVIPIFYDNVDPADVKTTDSKFGEAFQKLLKEEKNIGQEHIWKKALQDVKGFAGFESRTYRKEPDLLDTIVYSLRNKICPMRYLHFAQKAIGADRLVDDVILLLKIDQEDVRMIGISGTEGIGKTMVARAVCKGTIKEFERFIFLDELGKSKHSDFCELQKKLLQNLLEKKGQMLHDSVNGNIIEIKKNLHCKKILLVLDGVSNEEQMKKLGAKNRERFHPGSRILITTRDRNLLKDLNVDDEYIVEGLNQDEAFGLFCHHAFKSEKPREGYEELSRHLAHYAGGHPLALKKWGSFLTGKSKYDLQIYSDQLMKNPDLTSIASGLGRFFKEYPFKVVGPYGGYRSTDTWKDEGYTDVRKIIVGFDSRAIKLISILYDKYGCPCNLVTHGTKGGAESTIELKYPNEYLTSISGYTKKISGRTILQSLTFHTNGEEHAPIGTNNGGSKFSFPYTGGKIIGFHGSCNGPHLESIGAFYEPIPHTYPVTVFGPFGGTGETSWDLGQRIDISKIVVRCGLCIHSIDFDSVDANGSEGSARRDRDGGENTFEIKLENADEYIIAFSGYFKHACNGRILINSLMFQTNKRILGPIGREGGYHFSSPSEAGKVIGFFGRSDDYLESIGARVELYSNKLYPFKSVGLFGSSKESNWDDGNDHTNVREIEIEPGDGKFIRSIKFWYEKNGRSCPLEGRGGEDVDRIEIDDPDEYLTSMSGYYMDGGITCLMFGTNKRTLELIGREEGIHFSSPATGGKIVGFYGRRGEHLEAIGAYFEPISHLYPIKSIGPFGGSTRETWDRVEFKGLRKIKVRHNVNIHWIELVYTDGSRERSYQIKNNRRAIREYFKTDKHTLDYPHEYLTSISGNTQDGAIQSLTFYSNKTRYGPFGKEDGKYFWYPSTGSKIIGFYGTFSETLNSIGVYAEPIPHMCPFKTVGPFGGAGGTPWDDGVHTDVRGFRISFGKAIKAIGIAYDNNGSFVSGSEHGSGHDNDGSFVLGLKPGQEGEYNYKEVLLDYPKERLVSISVWVDEDRETRQPIIHDLKIHTRKAVYGPFILKPQQEQEKPKFFIPSEEDGGRRIVGLFGTVGRYLNSIGARLETY